MRLVKADVESAEQHVVRALSRLLDAHVVEWVLLEISPVFRDDYLATVVEPLREAGYESAWRLHPEWRVWDEPWVLDFLKRNPVAEVVLERRRVRLRSPGTDRRSVWCSGLSSRSAR